MALFFMNFEKLTPFSMSYRHYDIIRLPNLKAMSKMLVYILMLTSKISNDDIWKGVTENSISHSLLT